MENRREFLKKAMLLSGGLAFNSVFPETIRRALEIDPEKGSTFYDAEHIVFLMQENRSFDHLYGCLRGVRGFNDPRVIELPNRNKVWLQSNNKGVTYLPFRLNTFESKAPWMGSTPHGWADQTDARNGGRYDQWLNVKRPMRKEYADVPFTLGYCDRVDFPFYYSLADAFTICDQHFSSSITGTHPNRWYWMTGTVRESNVPQAVAHLWNISDYKKPTLSWKTFPERLQEAGIPWKVYQNDLTMVSRLKDEQSSWLGNFGTNVLEYFTQYNVLLHRESEKFLKERRRQVTEEIENLKNSGATPESNTRLAASIKTLEMIDRASEERAQANYEALTPFQKELNENAFTINDDDPDFQSLELLKYDDNGVMREFLVPKGDVLHKFREDVRENKLPLVSWIMPPANFSDHPGQPWFGSWYVNEVMEILLENPDVWKKTIFVLTYDENDGFFDHVPPYAVPDPYHDGFGKVSEKIDARMDWVLKDQQTNPSSMADRLRESSVGLGFRVPLIIASPWSRGGYVNSEIFDHTSSLQFLENFIQRKTGKKIHEENITHWRREICGDLTSVFRKFDGQSKNNPDTVKKEEFFEHIHKSFFKDIPHNYRPLSDSEIQQINENPHRSELFPKQEEGVKPSCAIPYELHANLLYDGSQRNCGIYFESSKNIHGERSAGAPFMVYSLKPYKADDLKVWNYTVSAGENLSDFYSLEDFKNSEYHLRVYGPNGFFREFRGNLERPNIQISCSYRVRNNILRTEVSVLLDIANYGNDNIDLLVADKSYNRPPTHIEIAAGSKKQILLNVNSSHGWYDFEVTSKQHKDWTERFAGHVESGKESITDPVMGKMQ